MKPPAPQLLRNVDLTGKKVLIRGDLDVDDGDNPRVRSVIEVVKYGQEHGAEKIKVMGHRETDYLICNDLREIFPGVEFDDTLRNNPGEKTNNAEFAKELVSGWDVYVNEAFATSHRKHASLVAVPEVMKAEGKTVCAGLRFEQELLKLSQVWSRPGRRVLVIGGVKVEDKQKFAEEMRDKFAEILKGGLLPGAQLRSDGLDLAETAISRYEQAIGSADVILAAGVMGKYEEENASMGTRRILEAIANNSFAYKVAGGGDIEMAISRFGLTEKFEWISVGGGAMLVFLGTGTLVGLEALG